MIFLLVDTDFYDKNISMEVSKATEIIPFDIQLEHISYRELDKAEASTEIIYFKDEDVSNPKAAKIDSSVQTLNFPSKCPDDSCVTCFDRSRNADELAESSFVQKDITFARKEMNTAYIVENEENQVYLDIISNKKIEEHDVNSILIFFGNERATGGGEILDFKLHESKNLLDGSHKLSIRYKYAYKNFIT